LNSLPPHRSSTDYLPEAGFLRGLMTVMAVVVVAGFVVNLSLGRSSFSAPAIVHVHAVTFMAWIGIIVAQVWLVGSGAVAAHRRLGRLALFLCVALAVTGLLVTLNAVRTGRVPFFFQPQHFLIADPMTLVASFLLVGAAVALRKRTDWHARLQVGAFLPLMGPGFGRLLPLPLLMSYAFEIAGLAALGAAAVGMVRDKRRHGRVHPAWWWGVAVLVGALMLARVVAFSPFGDSLYQAATAHTAFAGSDGRAFPPPPQGP
jgi:hypothetical protein